MHKNILRARLPNTDTIWGDLSMMPVSAVGEQLNYGANRHIGHEHKQEINQFRHCNSILCKFMYI
jgi:hypothetical protein